MIKIEFTGIPSGDYESFCWDVDKDTFVKITGKNPSKYDKSMFNKGLYRIYPTDVMKTYEAEGSECKQLISIQVTDLVK